MPQAEPDLFYVDANTIRRVKAKLSKSPQNVDQQIAKYLQHYQSISVAQLGVAAMEAEVMKSPEEGLEPVLHMAFMTSSGWGVEFIKNILQELREIICSPKRGQGKLRGHTQALLAAIAAMLMQKLGFASPTANGFAVLILLTIGRATKKAFCNMTDEEVLAALSRNN